MRSLFDDRRLCVIDNHGCGKHPLQPAYRTAMALWTGFPIGTGKLKILEDSCDSKIVLRCRAQSGDFERKLSIKFALSDSVQSTSPLSLGSMSAQTS